MSAINYSRVTFKDYPDTTTPITAENLNKMDKGVYDLDQALTTANTNIANLSSGKQDKLTNPLTKSDVINNLTTSTTNVPLSAAQGKALKDTIDALDVSAPSASGTAVAFIDSVSQSNGKISATKKTVSTVAKGSAGLCPALPNETSTSKFLRQDGSWVAPPDNNTWRGIQDNVNSTSASDSLSANQGYIMARDIPWYGTCSTAAGTAAKVATTSDTKFALVTGAKVTVKFTYENTASNITLNVDGKGAKSVKAYGTSEVAARLSWASGDVVNFVYDGTYWIMLPNSGQVYTLLSLIENLDGKLGVASGEKIQVQWVNNMLQIMLKLTSTIWVLLQAAADPASTGYHIGLYVTSNGGGSWTAYWQI